MSQIQSAAMVLPCKELEKTLAFFLELGFRLETILPADKPSLAVVRGHGLRLCLDLDHDGDPGSLRLACDDPLTIAARATELTAPNGTKISLVQANPPLELPENQAELVISRANQDDIWTAGRADMLYRDLLPKRQGGRFIASHIGIPNGGPVNDYVHYHKVRFQMIYFYKGAIKVVYEDQGEAMVFQPGDCVLQPPGIRHRVLACEAGAEVIEIGCPAVHETWQDLELELPTKRFKPERDFGGQRYVHHQVESAHWQAHSFEGFEARDFGFVSATAGLARASVLRPKGEGPGVAWVHELEFYFLFVLVGGLVLVCDGGEHSLEAGDCFTIPAGMAFELKDCSGDLQMLEVRLPGE